MGITIIEGSPELYNDPNIEYKPYTKGQLKIVDTFIRQSRGRGGEIVSSEKDWKFVEDILSFWVSQFPNEASQFLKDIKLARATRLNSKGYNSNKEIKYLASLPFRFERMIKVFFPFQQFDKKFMAAFTKRLPNFKVGGY